MKALKSSSRLNLVDDVEKQKIDDVLQSDVSNSNWHLITHLDSGAVTNANEWTIYLTLFHMHKIVGLSLYNGKYRETEGDISDVLNSSLNDSSPKLRISLIDRKTKNRIIDKVLLSDEIAYWNGWKTFHLSSPIDVTKLELKVIRIDDDIDHIGIDKYLLDIFTIYGGINGSGSNSVKLYSEYRETVIQRINRLSRSKIGRLCKSISIMLGGSFVIVIVLLFSPLPLPHALYVFLLEAFAVIIGFAVGFFSVFIGAQISEKDDTLNPSNTLSFGFLPMITCPVTAILSSIVTTISLFVWSGARDIAAAFLTCLSFNSLVFVALTTFVITS